MLARVATALAILPVATAAWAQWVPGMEITGQQMQVQTNGVINTITFGPDGVAHISSPSGARVVDANWTAHDGKLCLKTASTSDCYPYRAPFTARQPVDLMSDCGVMSRWTPLSTAVAPGERG